MLTKKEFCSMQDHSCLGWICDYATVKQYCDETLQYGFASVVVNPDMVEYCNSVIEKRAGIGAVIGFPQGIQSTKIKIAEALEAIDNGATDVDIVTNFSMLRNREDKKLGEQYRDIVAAVRDRKPETVVKFIMYQPFGKNPSLTEDETRRVAALIATSGADYIKFCCDFDLIRAEVGKDIKMKHSGCADFYAAVDAIEKGCTRIGHDEAAKWMKQIPDSYFAE